MKMMMIIDDDNDVNEDNNDYDDNHDSDNDIIALRMMITMITILHFLLKIL